VGAAIGKLTGAKQFVDGLEHLGVHPPVRRAIAGLEHAGAAGVIVGLWVEWAGILAAIGLILLMVGAVGCHIRAGDRASRSLRQQDCSWYSSCCSSSAR